MSTVPAPPPRHKKKSSQQNELDDSYSAEQSPIAGSGANAVRQTKMPTYQDVSVTPNVNASRSTGGVKEVPRAISPNSLSSGIPETVIGEYVVVKGELEFDRLLRIDGLFEGKLISEGDLIVGAQGKLIGNVVNMRSMLVEGHVVGNISVEKIALRANAFVYGDITCREISVEPTVRLVGKLNVHADAPKQLNADGNLVEERIASVQSVSPPVQKNSSPPKNKGEFHFPGTDGDNVQTLVASNEKQTLVPSTKSQKSQAADEAKLQHLAEQQAHLEKELQSQRDQAERARLEDEAKIKLLSDELESLRTDELQRAQKAKEHLNALAKDVSDVKAQISENSSENKTS